MSNFWNDPIVIMFVAAVAIVNTLNGIKLYRWLRRRSKVKKNMRDNNWIE